MNATGMNAAALFLRRVLDRPHPAHPLPLTRVGIYFLLKVRGELGVDVDLVELEGLLDELVSDGLLQAKRYWGITWYRPTKVMR